VNLLAHAALASPGTESLLGNFAADFLSPSDVEALSPGVRAGVMQHRRVDAFTDRHPAVQRSVRRLAGRWGWFSGILIDVYYDHVLSLEWDAHVGGDRRAFIDGVHETLLAAAGGLPPATGEVVRGFVRADRLGSYADPDGLADALSRLSDRIAARIPTRAVRLEQAMPELLSAHADLSADFAAFWPEVRRQAAK
jgi:acyl carrier protein phosphodiesterase